MIQIRETYINATKGWGIGESDWYEPYTDNRGDLFRAMRKEYGRCISTMYMDHPIEPGIVLKIGWVFQGRDQYQDSKETYLREVWVQVKEVPDDDA
jgi:hypothetical protein